MMKYDEMATCYGYRPISICIYIYIRMMYCDMLYLVGESSKGVLPEHLELQSPGILYVYKHGPLCKSSVEMFVVPS